MTKGKSNKPDDLPLQKWGFDDGKHLQATVCAYAYPDGQPATKPNEKNVETVFVRLRPIGNGEWSKTGEDRVNDLVGIFNTKFSTPNDIRPFNGEFGRIEGGRKQNDREFVLMRGQNTPDEGDLLKIVSSAVSDYLMGKKMEEHYKGPHTGRLKKPDSPDQGRGGRQ